MHSSSLCDHAVLTWWVKWDSSARASSFWLRPRMCSTASPAMVASGWQAALIRCAARAAHRRAQTRRILCRLHQSEAADSRLRADRSCPESSGQEDKVYSQSSPQASPDQADPAQTSWVRSG